MSTRVGKVAKRACDACKIRKIKCNEQSPCSACIQAGIACTYIRPASVRGPRKLRRETLQEIQQSQRQWQDFEATTASAIEPVVHTQLTPESVFSPTKVASLVLQLCIYRLRVYPAWPILKIERLVASLQQSKPDIEVFALAYGVAAATIAQIRQKPPTQPGAVTAEMMLDQCLYAKEQRNKDLPPDLTTVRIPFFLHIYYENIDPGGIKSIKYLREAIAVAHLVGLHRESYYTNVQAAEREIRRRTFWLLFIAERSMAIPYKLPIIIKPKLELPSTNDSDEKQVLVAYQQLVGLYRILEEAQVFEMLDQYEFDLAKIVGCSSAQRPALLNCFTQVNNYVLDTETVTEIQAVDIHVTRQWMRVIIWLLLGGRDDQYQSSAENGTASIFPVTVAQELLISISQMPETAVEAHGPNLETKMFDIASTIIDTIIAQALRSGASPRDSQNILEVLSGLHRFLGKNQKLNTRLQEQLSHLQQSGLTQPLPHSTEWLFENNSREGGFDYMEALEIDSPLSQLSNHSKSQQEVPGPSASTWSIDQVKLIEENDPPLTQQPFLPDWPVMNFDLDHSMDHPSTAYHSHNT